MTNFPYTDLGQTYADHIGASYYYYAGAIGMGALLAFIFSSIQCYRAWYNTKFNSHLIQRRTLIAICLMSFFFLIQSIDPQGYQDRIPQVVEVYSAGFSTYFGITILFVLIMTITRVFQTDLNIYQFPSIKNLTRENYFWLILFTIFTAGSFILPALQVFVNRSVFRGVKLILFSTLLLIASLRTNYLLIVIYRKLTDNGSNTIRLRVHLFIFNLVIPFIIVMQLFYGIRTLNSNIIKPELNMEQYIFPFTELFIILFGTSFMSKIT